MVICVFKIAGTTYYVVYCIQTELYEISCYAEETGGVIYHLKKNIFLKIFLKFFKLLRNHSRTYF